MTGTMEDASIDKEKLINVLKQHEFLYHKDNLLYKNKVKCAKAWQAIAEEMEIAGRCEPSVKMGGDACRILAGSLAFYMHAVTAVARNP